MGHWVQIREHGFSKALGSSHHFQELGVTFWVSTIDLSFSDSLVISLLTHVLDVLTHATPLRSVEQTSLMTVYICYK